MIRNLLLNRNNWDKTAVLEEEKSYTYRDLAEKAAAVRGRLRARPRENIAIFLPNGADYIAALFGVWMAGMTAFPLNTQLTAYEIAPLLEQTSSSTVVTCAAYLRLFGEVSPANTPVKVILMEELEVPEHGMWTDPAGILPDDPIILLTTSGTTGRAKIVQLTEQNIETAVFGYMTYSDHPRFSDVEIRYILGTPFSSVYGLLILPVCIVGAFPVVVPGGALTLDMFYRAAEKYGVTHYEGGTAIPVLMEQMLDRPISYDIRTLRFVGFGGSKISPDVLRRLDKAFPAVEFCPGYGMTESAALIARPYKRVKLDKRDSIGTAIPGVTVRVDTDGAISGVPLAVGELVVRGTNVTPGYYRNDDETRKIVKDGWLYTGDIGYVDADGDIFICGRKKNVVMVRGFSVYAEEVEASIQSSGHVKECVVYGETDSAGVETLCASVVPMSPEAREENIRVWCMEHLADYKRPSRIRMVGSIAKTATGKAERGAGGTE